MKNTILLTIFLSLITLPVFAGQPAEIFESYTLKQSTVIQLNGVSVGCVAVFRSVYALPDGSEQKGLTAFLYIDSEPPREIAVGRGSRFEVDGALYEVERVRRGFLRKRDVVIFYRLQGTSP